MAALTLRLANLRATRCVAQTPAKLETSRNPYPMKATAEIAPTTKTPAKKGRPSKFTPAIGKQICDRIARGERLIDICKAPGMPTMWTVRLWYVHQIDSAFVHQYARARIESADSVADEVETVAQEVRAGTLAPDAGRVVMNGLTWLAKVRKPAVYGDQLKVDGTITHDIADRLLVARQRALIEAPQEDKGGE